MKIQWYNTRSSKIEQMLEVCLIDSISAEIKNQIKSWNMCITDNSLEIFDWWWANFSENCISLGSKS